MTARCGATPTRPTYISVAAFRGGAGFQCTVYVAHRRQSVHQLVASEGCSACVLQVPAENMVGKENGATICMMRNLEIERVGLAAMSVGIARRLGPTICI